MAIIENMATPKDDRAMEVSVRDLKDHLSEYLRRVQAGEEIVVTSHGKPVGRLVGPAAGGSAPERDAVAGPAVDPFGERAAGCRLRISGCSARGDHR